MSAKCLIHHDECINHPHFTLIIVCCILSIRAMRRLEAARVQKDVAEATKVIRQQELHKSLRVRGHFTIKRNV